MTPPVAILAGGLATRLGSITATVPKALVDVGGRPFIAHQLSLLDRAGVRRVVLCVGHLGDAIEGHLGSGFGNIALSYSYDGPRLLGTGGALRRALPLLDDSFFVLYGDSYLDFDYAAMARDFAAHGGEPMMSVYRNDDRWETSNIRVDAGFVKAYDKKRQPRGARHIDYGVSILTRAVVERLPDEEPSDLERLLGDLATEGRLHGHEVASRFYEIGSPAGLAELRAHLMHHVVRR